MLGKSRVRFSDRNEDSDEESAAAASASQWQPHNRSKLSERELLKLSPARRRIYLAYETPSKQVLEEQKKAKKRISEKSQKEKLANQSIDEEEEIEREKQEKLIGQLKAAEARSRIRLTRMRHEENVKSDVNHLIACQSSAAEAVRLEALLPPVVRRRTRRSPAAKDSLDKLSRERAKHLMTDCLGILTERT